MKADRTIDEVRDGLWELQRTVGTLASEVVHLRPSFRLLFRRSPLEKLEHRFNEQLTTMTNLQADLIALASKVPTDINAAMRHDAWFSTYFGISNSVRGLLAQTSDAIGSIRNELAVRGSLFVAVAAFVVALVSAFADVIGLF